MKKLAVALFGALVLGLSSPASASEPGCECDKASTKEAPATMTRWVDISTHHVLECRMFNNMVTGQVTEGPCNGYRVRCYGGGVGTMPQLCQAQVTGPKFSVEIEPTRVIREKIIIQQVPVERERTIVRKRYTHVEREHGGGGRWVTFPHSESYGHFPYKSVATGEWSGPVTRNGITLKCRGGRPRDSRIRDRYSHRYCLRLVRN